jgi:hypothetical protein
MTAAVAVTPNVTFNLVVTSTVSVSQAETSIVTYAAAVTSIVTSAVSVNVEWFFITEIIFQFIFIFSRSKFFQIRDKI